MTDSKIAAIVTQFVYPDDREIRVRKFAITLRALGYQVHVLCGSNGHNFDFIDQDGNIIHRINVCWQLPFIHRILKASFPTNPIWYIWILLTCWKNKINFILVRDLRLSHPGLIAGKILGIPRIIDFGEDFPSLYKIVGYSEILIKLSCWLEKLAINLADKVTVVSEESKQKLEDDYVISPNKIITLPNVPAPSLVWDWGSTIPYETFPNAKNELKLICTKLLTFEMFTSL